MATPWMTSNDLIATIKRGISMPISQSLFSENDILAFCNQEVAISQVPSILEFHQEYLVSTKLVPMSSSVSRYPIPDRAIGMKLRDLFWQDQGGNLYKMTQSKEEDKASFQRNIGLGNSIQMYYIEGNDVVLTPEITGDPSGFLVFNFFLRPNQLVTNDRAAIIAGFKKTVTVSNSTLVVGNVLTIGSTILTCVAGSPSSSQFVVGINDITTATNIVTALNNLGLATIGDNMSPSTNVITISYPLLSTSITSSNSSALTIQSSQSIAFDQVPLNITSNSEVDFLQTKPGHKIRSYDILIPMGGVSGASITFNSSDVPQDLIVGDYVCSVNECIIPNIPPDLHTGLAERASARILASMGDAVGLQIVNDKIADIDKRQGNLLDNRVDGSPRKVTNRYSLLSWGSSGNRRRF